MSENAFLRPAGMRPVKARRAAHTGHLSSYPLNDSPAGIRLLHARGFRRIDVNWHVSKDGALIPTHWKNPLAHGWYDPTGRIRKRSTRVWHMTTKELQRLRHRTEKRARIVSATRMFALFARLGITMEFEAKESPQFANSDLPWQRLVRHIAKSGVRVVVKAIHNLGAGLERLRRAHAHGLPTMLLPRGTRRVPRAAWRYTDQVRGVVRWV